MCSVYMRFFNSTRAEISRDAKNTSVEFHNSVAYAARLALALGRYFIDARGTRG